MRCQCLDPGYTSVTDCRNRLIRGSLIIARFSAVGMGVGLYAGRLIREYIWYSYKYDNDPLNFDATEIIQFVHH